MGGAVVCATAPPSPAENSIAPPPRPLTANSLPSGAEGAPCRASTATPPSPVGTYSGRSPVAAGGIVSVAAAAVVRVATPAPTLATRRDGAPAHTQIAAGAALDASIAPLVVGGAAVCAATPPPPIKNLIAPAPRRPMTTAAQPSAEGVPRRTNATPSPTSTDAAGSLSLAAAGVDKAVASAAVAAGRVATPSPTPATRGGGAPAPRPSVAGPAPFAPAGRTGGGGRGGGLRHHPPNPHRRLNRDTAVAADHHCRASKRGRGVAPRPHHHPAVAGRCRRRPLTRGRRRRLVGGKGGGGGGAGCRPSPDARQVPRRCTRA